MNEKINYTGGEPTINFNDLNRDDTANRTALFGIMKAFNIGTNENFIISGCVATLDTGVDVDVTAGYIFLNEEILQVEAQTVLNGGTLDLYKYVKTTTYDANGTKTFNNAISRQTWAKHRGIVTAATAPILTTELDVISGDRLEDKIVQLTKASQAQVDTGTNDTRLVTPLKLQTKLAGVLLGSDPTFSTVTGAISTNNITYYNGLKKLQFSGTMSYSSATIPSGTTLITVPITSFSPAPSEDIYGFLFIDVGAGFVDVKVKYTTSRTIVLLETSPIIGTTEPFHINMVY